MINKIFLFCLIFISLIGIRCTTPSEEYETGAQGETGPTGSVGELGPTGESGPTGETGKTGPSGYTGESGTPGSIGDPGINGQPGASGATGETGSSGTNGQNGVCWGNIPPEIERFTYNGTIYGGYNITLFPNGSHNIEELEFGLMTMDGALTQNPSQENQFYFSHVQPLTGSVSFIAFASDTCDLDYYSFTIDLYSYRVTYNGNGNTGGDVPIDPIYYDQGQNVTVTGNTGNLLKVGEYFAGWNTQSDGNGTTYANGQTFSMGSTNMTLYARWGYALRDIGPAGGWIFYDKGSYSSGWRYLEAAPASTEWTLKIWEAEYTLIGGTAVGIGTGQSNTTIIVSWLNVHGESDRAAQLCDALTFGGYSDWFLPSMDELNLIYTNLRVFGIGDFSGNYWSSSEDDDYRAWMQNFENGGQKYGIDKIYYPTSVRAVRAF